MSGQPVEGLPHDIRGLIPYQPTVLDRWPWILGAILLLALLIFAGLYWRKFRARKAVEPPVDAWDLLEQRLARLVPGEPFTDSIRVAFFYELSLGLREAIERRTGVRATDMTLDELREPLRRKLPLSAGETEELLAFLQRADLVKFAEVAATADEALAEGLRVRNWTSSLRPRSDVGATTPPSGRQAEANEISRDLALNENHADIFNGTRKTFANPEARSSDDFSPRRGTP